MPPLGRPGGGRVLHVVTRKNPPPSRQTLELIKGVIAYAPHVLESRPVSLRPHVGSNLSHNTVTNRAWEEDPLIRTQGTLKALSELLDDGEELALNGYLAI
ncbi:hypothetical protein BU17DRAFT_61929 [Hysterangium stoloniferum]|nr:hypothetical protein BU17DRAFT_61929 [Hysterangium stoloniferum]